MSKSKKRKDNIQVSDKKLIYLNMELMKEICLADIDHFEQYGQRHDTRLGRYFYKDNGSNILAIAHLDTVQNLKHFIHTNLVEVGHGNFVYNAQLDDRLGAYIILDMLPRLGINVDVLLTEGEESGRSTGQCFELPEGKTYNWMFQFDRAGDDVVMYDYETDELVALLKASGLKVGIGSYSDIASMDFLGISGFNFGCGYHENHGVRSYANLHETIQMINGFVRFWQANKNKTLPYVEQPHKARSYGSIYTWWEKQADGTLKEFVSKDYDYKTYRHNNGTDTKRLTYGWDDWTSGSDTRLVDDYLCEECGKDCWNDTGDVQFWVEFGMCESCFNKAMSEDFEQHKAKRPECQWCGSLIPSGDQDNDDENGLCGHCVRYIAKNGEKKGN